jgi:sterol 3beta-glucosyltransferase
MPWTKTVAFPHAFISPPVDSPSFNAGSYVLFNNVFWAASSGQVNKWRKNTLGIPSTDLHKLQLKKIPFLYNFSPSVVPKPLDWSDDITICGK